MYLIDTNIYSALDRGEATVSRLLRDEPEIGVPLPVLAELRYGFALGDRAEANERTLRKFIAQPAVRVVLPGEVTTRHYAELHSFCRRSGRSLSQNDIWIAALVRETGGTLLTFDKDFAALQDLLDGGVRLIERR